MLRFYISDLSISTLLVTANVLRSVHVPVAGEHTQACGAQPNRQMCWWYGGKVTTCYFQCLTIINTVSRDLYHDMHAQKGRDRQSRTRSTLSVALLYMSYACSKGQRPTKSNAFDFVGRFALYVMCMLKRAETDKLECVRLCRSLRFTCHVHALKGRDRQSRMRSTLLVFAVPGATSLCWRF
jgi:hypothetical protein